MAADFTHAEITASVIDAAVRLHQELGPGMLESAYELLLADELSRRGHEVERQRTVRIVHRGRTVDRAFRIDLLIDRLVVVEVKCSERHSPVYRRQLLTYLRLMKLEVGLMLNFGLPTMKAGIARVINTQAR
ncbi:GxxExxY protein [Gemmatimonas sp.]|jgi:iron complex transport system substrate-binding protein|uniref:GxxExxY protein n=1 Tax=Gemmatimonas sp. TaxID=1962908 RepID=UPI0037BE5751